MESNTSDIPVGASISSSVQLSQSSVPSTQLSKTVVRIGSTRWNVSSQSSILQLSTPAVPSTRWNVTSQLSASQVLASPPAVQSTASNLSLESSATQVSAPTPAVQSTTSNVTSQSLAAQVSASAPMVELTVSNVASQSSASQVSSSSRSQCIAIATNTTIDWQGLRYEMMPGTRSTSILLHTLDEQQLYRQRVLYKNVRQYDCKIEDCNSKVYLNTTTGVCFSKEKFRQHTHGSREIEIKKMALVKKMKEDCGKLSTLASINSPAGNANVRSVYQKCLTE